MECGGEEEKTQEMGEEERESEKRDLNDWDWIMECTPRTACDDVEINCQTTLEVLA